MSKKTNNKNQQNPTQDAQEKLAYNPKAIESKIYEICKNRGYFELEGNADLAKKRQERLHKKQKNGEKISPKDTHFCIMMPPPNVTGVLHIGHALTLSLQDIIVRFKRMQGYTTLYQPGLDHAGIATQNVVEKQLLAKGIKKEELGREEFIKKVWEWKEESGGKILGQMEALGISPALSRTRFTMDKGLQQAVREAFVAWYEKGLIYEGDYMVNWCTHDGALSDIEVQYEAQETKLYYIAYKIVEGNSSLGESNLSLGNHCRDFADFEGSQATQPSSPPKSTKNSTSTTANTIIVRENGGTDSSDCVIASKQGERGNPQKKGNINPPSPNYQNMAEEATNDKKSPPSLAEGVRGRVESPLKSSLESNTKSSLQDLPKASRDNPQTKIYHTDGAQASEVSQRSNSKRDTSISTKSKPDKSQLEINCHANADTFTHNDKTTFPQDALVVATTRPETFFGDVAVMINPNDSRYAHLIGQKVILPLLNKQIPIIADSAVDMEFGTGVVKVTPAHDINDYEVGKRHGLENLVIFDEKGIFNENAQGFAGRERLEAREDIVAALDSCGALLKTEDYQNQVGTCYRCGNLIEPYISKQWFVSKEVATNAIKRVNDGETKFYPSAWLNNFNAWMRELRPWCISRQLWWGHRIPIWDCQNPKCLHRFASKNEVESSCPKCGGEVVQEKDVLDTWFSSGLWAFSTLGWGNSSLGNGNSSAGSHCIDFADFESSQAIQPSSLPKSAKNSTSTTSPTSIDRKNGVDYVSQDYSKNADFSANSDIPSLRASDSERGNPQKTGNINSPSPNYQNMAGGTINDKKNPPSIAEGVRGRVEYLNNNDSSTPYAPDDLENFYPNSLLITGFDILFFWVARMLFSGESLLGKLPFRDIYLHALVRDENGQKMSKSRGNVIDPLEMIDKYGADSLRFSLAYLCAQGRDIRLSSAQLEISKNFANKLFNATQFLRLYAHQIDSSFNGFCEISQISQYKTPLGKYAKSRLNVATSEIINALESYRFNDGASVLYRFLWGEFCDWCIELAKAQKEAIHELGAVLIDALKLLCPYMPFISEELYHSLKGQTLDSAQSIMIAEFPSESTRDLEIEAEFESIKNAIISLRRLKASVDLANKPIERAYIEFDKCTKSNAKSLESIQKLARVESVQKLDSTQIDIKNCVVDIGEGVKCYLPLDNIDLAPILSRLDAQKTKLQKEREKLESNLKNDRFLSNAPKEVVSKLESSLQEVLQKLEKIQSEIKTLDRK